MGLGFSRPGVVVPLCLPFERGKLVTVWHVRAAAEGVSVGDGGAAAERVSLARHPFQQQHGPHDRKRPAPCAHIWHKVCVQGTRRCTLLPTS
jgi:hypothetical protein